MTIDQIGINVLDHKIRSTYINNTREKKKKVILLKTNFFKRWITFLKNYKNYES